MYLLKRILIFLKLNVVRDEFISFLNVVIFSHWSTSSKYFFGLRKELYDWEEVEHYLKKREESMSERFIWKVFSQQIHIPKPIVTVSTPVPSAEINELRFSYNEYICKLKKARVYGKHYAVITEDDYLIQPVSNYYSDFRKNHQYYKSIFLPRVREIKGRTLLIKGGDVFYHVMIEAMPTMRLLAEIGLNSKDFDHVLVPYYNQKWYKNFFSKLNFHESQIIALHEKDAVECSELYITSYYERHGSWYINQLKNLFKASVSNNCAIGNKIYISRNRTPNRKVINEEEVTSFLEKHGFVTIFAENYSIEEQAYIFSNVDFIISTHGSNLVNIVFCKPGTSVCEIRYTKHNAYHKKTYQAIASHNNLNYFLLYCQEGRQVHGFEETDSDVKVRIADLERILYSMHLHNA